MHLKKYLFITLFLANIAVSGAAYEYDVNDFATEVVYYVQGSGLDYDWMYFINHGQLVYYNDPQTALGRPTSETTGDMDIGEEVAMPVVPVYPAWRAFEIVTVGSGGELVLRFNHRLADDENNLYGTDFIIFGNSRWRVASGGSWTETSNPETVTVGTTFYSEQGIVSVSQDGTNWYSFPNGPYADDFAPTASYNWDDFNDLWADELDPTRPVDPNLTIAGFDGNSVAEIIYRYDGSAGGTGYDLEDLAPADYNTLSTDPDTGRKWIQYVKIVDNTADVGLPEIDAVSDVSCCGDYKHPFPSGDISKDCVVDYKDVSLLNYYWLTVISEPDDPAKAADIYEDDIVDFYDWTIIADNWLSRTW